MAYELDWAALSAVLRAGAGLLIGLLLVYIVRKDWPIPTAIRVIIWALIWAIGGAIIGMADDEIELIEGVLLGAFWGALLALVGLSRGRRPKNNGNLEN
jgi:hypothetical protein